MAFIKSKLAIFCHIQEIFIVIQTPKNRITLFNFSIKMKNISINVVKVNVLNEFSAYDSKRYKALGCFIA